MHVIATAGHVDHGKSTLVRALTGVDPDRLEEERRRGLSIRLGYCWTSLPGAGEVAFVDVPGHERFVATMLSGIGPVPAVLFVAAADDPWMPQAAEHLAALHALGVSRGVLAVTRADLADPVPALDRARSELARTSLRGAPGIAVSGRTGAGLDELRAALVELVGSLPDPDPAADVRLWVDRCFHISGAGTVVTGTLPAGTIRAGEALALDETRVVRVRGVQALDRPVGSVVGVSRVALNVTGADVDALDAGSVLVTPRAWEFTDVLDVRVTGGSAAGGMGGRVPQRPLLHVGATSVAGHFRPLGEGLARITLDRRLPLRIGDRALLRDPGSRVVWGITVLDPAPPPLGRRGAAGRRAVTLTGLDGARDLAGEVARRGLTRRSLLRRIGVDPDGLGAPADDAGAPVVAGDWVLSAERAAGLRAEVRRLVEEHDRSTPLDRGVPVAALAQSLGLPEQRLVTGLVAPPLRVVGGRVLGPAAAELPASVERGLATMAEELAGAPFAAPTADRLAELGLDAAAVAAASKAGRLLRVADRIVLLPGADALAASWLAELAQPFTTSEARIRLDTSRRVVLPLLAHLDRVGLTRRYPDDRRSVVPRRPAAGG